MSASIFSSFLNSALNANCVGNLTTLLGGAVSACNLASALQDSTVGAALTDSTFLSGICSSSCANTLTASSFSSLVVTCANAPLFNSTNAGALSGLLGPSLSTLTAAGLAADIGALQVIACQGGGGAPSSCLSGLITTLATDNPTLKIDSLGAFLTSYSVSKVLCTSCGLGIVTAVKAFINGAVNYNFSTVATIASVLGVSSSVVTAFASYEFTASNCSSNKASNTVTPSDCTWKIIAFSVVGAAAISYMANLI